ncbi:hypothetical protein [Streptomyces uncialis]|uniref:hypothetical protein n=1 Tax=Streptomyces uncialis TaxID=1048205 RepID=UPI0037B4BDC6
MTLTRPRPQAGTNDDTDDAAFHQLVQHLVMDGDLRAARLGRRAPRTLAAMQARMADDACGLCGCWICRCAQEAGLTRTPSGPGAALVCTACGGTGGRVEDTSSGGVRRRTWIGCGSCGGSGRR